jgi:predicted Zn-dependent peptidase
MIRKKTLENGLRIITIPLKNTRVATVFVLVKTGSKHEEKNVSGISHFLEHMLFKKTKKRPSPLKIAESLDKVGGIYNAFTGSDYTGYYAKVDVSQISLAIDWVSDIYLNSLLPEEEIEKEKGVIKEEINMYYDNPMSYVQILFQKLLYGDQPAGWDVAGTKETVSAIKRDDLLSYMQSQYVSENTVVVVAGNIQKKTEEEVIKKFSNIKKGEAKRNVPVFENQKTPQVESFYKETDQTHLCLGVRSFNIFHKHRYTQEVVATILGGMMSSRLFIKIRDELGLAYYVKTSVEDNPDTGVIVTKAGVENKKVEDAIRAIVKEYKRMKEESVSSKELKKAKEYLKGKTAILLESSDALAYFHGVNELLEKKIYDIKDVFSSVDKVNAKDIRDIAKETFKAKNTNLAIVGPIGKKRKLKEIIYEI